MYFKTCFYLFILSCFSFDSTLAQQIEVDTSLWVPNGKVRTILADNNTIYLGGDFTYIGPRTGGGAAINLSDGELSQSSLYQVEGTIRASIPDGKGGWYISGSFTKIQGFSRSGLAHILPNGLVDKNWNPKPIFIDHYLSKFSLALSGNTLYVGGFFTSIGGKTRNNLAAIDATTGQLTDWNPNVNGMVTSIIELDNKIYVGGFFTSIGGQIRNRLAAIDITTGQLTDWNPNISNTNPNSTVYSLALSGNTLYVGGFFTSIGGKTRNNLAAIDATTGQLTDWNPDANGTIYTLFPSGNIMYLGGDFTIVNGQSRANLAAVNSSTGKSTTWNPGGSGTINTLFVTDNIAYVGGYFSSIGGKQRSGLAAFDATTGALTSWNPKLNGGNRGNSAVYTLSIVGNRIYIGGDFYSIGGQTRNYLAAIDANTGKLTGWNPDSNNFVTSLVKCENTLYVAGAFNTIGGSTRNSLAAFNVTTGQLTNWNPNPNSHILDMTVSGNTIYIAGLFGHIAGQNRDYLAAFNATTGQLMNWNPNIGSMSPSSIIYSLATAGNTLYIGGSFTSISGQIRTNLAAIDTTGKLTDWNPNLNIKAQPYHSVNALTSYGNYIYAGGAGYIGDQQNGSSLAAINATNGEISSWKPDVDGIIYYLYPYRKKLYIGGFFDKVSDRKIPNFSALTINNSLQYVKGKIYEDFNGNCVRDKEDQGILNRIVVAKPGDYFTISDSLGNYTLALDSGNYMIEQIIPTDKKAFTKQICPTTPHTVWVGNNDTIIAGKDFVNQTSYYSLLSIGIHSSRRRRCFISTTKVFYENKGNKQEEDVKVYVKFPDYVVLVNASVPYTIDNEKNYVFSIGTLAANSKGSISILDSVVCNDPNIRGRTQCTKAWITPANASIPSPLWDKSDILLKANCRDNGRVHFALLNKGLGSMADSSSFRIFLDAKLAFKAHYKLAVGDSLILQVPANGQTVRLEADQRPYHPGKQQSNITIEACGINTAGNISLGFVAQLPQDDVEPEVAIECLPIIDSYDPNDKAVSPRGVTGERFTPTKTALNYLIRFQNTGTDVAYKVVVVDTLSKDVDMSTLQVGAVSHAYILTVSGKEKPILTFTFNNINLPDSTTNEPGSNGYINFSLTPKVDLPEKTRIENYADIFFDYNPAVRTNTTLNTIYDVPDVVDENVKLEASPICYTLNTTVNAGTNRILCEQDTLHLQAIAPIKGKGKWKLISGKLTIENINDAHTIVNGLGYGDHLLEWSVPTNSCSSDSLKAQILITRLAKPITPVITLIRNDSLLCSIEADNYEWYRNGESLTNSSRTISVNKEGNYTVRASNHKDCLSNMSVAFAYVLTSIEPDFASHIKIYPNPSNGRFTLMLPQQIGHNAYLQVIDAIGKTVISQFLQKNGTQIEVDLTLAPHGMYLIKIHTSKGIIVKRIAKK